MKKMVSLLLAMAMLMGMGIMANAADAVEKKAVETGFCGLEGENLTWTLYDDGELVISGQGDMEDYFADDFPGWSKLYDDISVITLEEGVTGIGSYAFYHKATYNRLNLPVSLEKIAYKGIDFGVVDGIRGFTDYGVTMQMICYAGTETQWGDVMENSGYDCDTDLSCFYGCDTRRIYYNGEEPETQCEIMSLEEHTVAYGESIILTPCAYSAEHPDGKGVKIVWHTSGFGLNANSYICDHGIEHISLTSHGIGSVVLDAQLVDEDGTVLASDSVKIKSKAGIKEIIDYLNNKIEEFFNLIIEFLIPTGPPVVYL